MVLSLVCQPRASPLSLFSRHTRQDGRWITGISALSRCASSAVTIGGFVEQKFMLSGASVMQAAACKWRGAAGAIFFPDKVFISRPYLGTRTFSKVRAQNNEEDAAASAAALADAGAPTIFDKIIKKEIPSTVVYEDEKVLAFRDINPQAPVHIVLIPKNRDGLTQLSKADTKHKDILGHLMYTTAVIAKQEGIEDGYRVVINNGPTACQSVFHLHLHIIGGRQLKWPPG